MDLLKTIRKNTFTTIISTIIIGIVIFLLAQLSAKFANAAFADNLTFWNKNVIFKSFMLIYSLTTILILNRGKLTGFGLSKPAKFNIFKLTGLTALITIFIMIFGTVVFIKILSNMFPQPGEIGFPQHNSIIEMILVVWLWSSFVEEVFVRSLLQTILSSLKNIKLFKLSLSVIISGLLFGSMHLSLLATGRNLWFVMHIVLFTSSIGILAAWYREKTDSIVPAFLVHLIANIFGSLPLLIIHFVK